MKHPIKTTILIVSSLLLYKSATASNWKLVDESMKSSKFIDIESIKIENNTVTFWVKTVYKNIQDFRGIKYKSDRAYIHINCKEKTMGSTKIVRYNSDEEAVFMGDYPLKLTPIIPDSYGEFLFKLQCE